MARPGSVTYVQLKGADSEPRLGPRARQTDVMLTADVSSEQ